MGNLSGIFNAEKNKCYRNIIYYRKLYLIITNPLSDYFYIKNKLAINNIKKLYIYFSNNGYILFY